jgi:Transcriptional regulator, Out at first
MLQQVEILRALILGEEERGQSQYQVMCFVSHFDKADGFIAPDAMAKLRQKNPGTVRTPEEDRGRHNSSMDGLLELHAAKLVSPLLPDVCAEAKDATYASLAALRIWSEIAGENSESAHVSFWSREQWAFSGEKNKDFRLCHCS